jgi:hypothetical protein
MTLLTLAATGRFLLLPPDPGANFRAGNIAVAQPLMNFFATLAAVILAIKTFTSSLPIGLILEYQQHDRV